MILDRGVCKIYRKTSTTPAGGKPTATVAVIHESYYAELNFETAPARPTERREDTKTATRVRILQNRGIRNEDVAELTPFDGTGAKTVKYRIARAWHGDDSESGEPISDLTLEVDERYPIQKPAAQGSGSGSGSSGSESTGGTTTGEQTSGNGNEPQSGEVTGNDGE